MQSMLRVALLSLLVASAPLVAQQPNDTTHRAGWDWDLSSVLSSRRGFEPRKRSRRERSERPAKTSSTGVRSPARSGLYAIEAIGFRTAERLTLFLRARTRVQAIFRSTPG